MFERIIRHGTLTTVAVLIISVLGVLAALRIPVQMIPDLEVRTITVRTSWPGATPQDVEKEILIEQEEYLQSIPNLERITATASYGEAEIELEFPFGIDMTETLIRVNNALTQVPDYPVNVDEPRIYSASFSENSFMYFWVAPLPDNPRSLDMALMRDYIDDHVRPRMETVEGVSLVEVGGGAERQIQVLLDPAALAERNLSPTRVRDAIQARNRDISGGDLEQGKRAYLLRTLGRFEDMEELRGLILHRDGDSVTRLRDVAEVRQHHFELRQLSSMNGKPVINLAVRRESGSNVIDIKYAMLAEVDEINREVLEPAGMRMALIAEDAGYVEASVRNVWFNLAIGAVFATLVMYLFLRSARATLVGVMGVPICAIAAFLGLLVTGRTVNVISLAGVAFAIGMTLDNSIVVLESIELERRKGLDKFRSSVAGVRKVWPAVLASTLTTVLVFTPIVFIEEEAGQLYSDIAIGVSASILVSMLVAITVIPTAAARLHFSGVDKGDGREHGLRRRTLAGVDWLLATPRRRLGGVGLALAVVLFIFLALTPPAEYLPEGEEPKTFVQMHAPPGYNLETMAVIGRELEDYFMPFVDDDPDRFRRGETEVPAMKYLNMRVAPQNLRIISEAVDPSQIEPLMDAIADKFDSYPGMRAFAARGSIITSNDGGTRSVNLDISGPELADIYAVGNAAYERAQEVFDNPRIQANPSTLQLAQPLVEIRPDWDRASEVGLTAQSLGFNVAALTDGAFVDEFFQADEKIDIFLFSSSGTDASLGTLGQLPIHTPGGGILPLSSLARVEETVDTSEVRRIGARRTVTLNIIPPREVALETGVQVVRDQVVDYLRAEGAIPRSVSLDISGASDQLQATREALGANYLVALAIIYLLLVAIFTHWGYPLLIMATIPLGVAGGIVGLVLMNGAGELARMAGMQGFHQPFDMISMLGFLILMGTVVNNPILVVHRAMTNLREGAASVREAVREAVASRLRPIAMATLTTVSGLSPLVFLAGEGTELYRGVGAIVLFGLMGTALVTISVLPALTVTVLTLGRGDRTRTDKQG